MIIVTGGAGFIGSNLVRALNDGGERDIVVVDDLSDGVKYRNLVDCDLLDYLDKNDFRQRIATDPGLIASADAVFHQGACSSTTEWDGKFMMDNNYRYSCELLTACDEGGTPLLYASSGAVYGGSQQFATHPDNERPLNVYGYSKLLFDQHVRRRLPSLKIPVIGFRYFNVYGPRESHKGGMASVAWHFSAQVETDNECHLFEGSDGYSHGEQRRDFVDVADVVKVNLWAWQQRAASGIYNVGTGRSQPFNDVADAVIDWYGRGQKRYIEFPKHLEGAYQSFTEADVTALRDAGFKDEFATVEQGTPQYLDWLASRGLRTR